MILRAFRRIPLPALRSQSQPDDKTLINFDTIFFTQAEPLTRQLTLLGQRVRLEITPSRFEWVHGDGTTATTTTPGAPYPAKDIVHRYADAHRTVAHRVVVTWSAEYSLNGGRAATRERHRHDDGSGDAAASGRGESGAVR